MTSNERRGVSYNRHLDLIQQPVQADNKENALITAPSRGESVGDQRIPLTWDCNAENIWGN